MYKATGPFTLTDGSCDYVDAMEFAERELLAYCPHEIQSRLAANVAKQVTSLMNSKEPFTVTQVNHHHFPDGETYWLPYFLFHIRHVLAGLVRFNYGVVSGLERKGEPPVQEKPYCMVEIVQGNLFVDARKYGLVGEVRRQILECILRSCNPLLDNGWNVALRRKEQNRSLHSPYFRGDVPYFCQYTSFDRNMSNRSGTHCWGLDTRNKLVRRLLKEGKEASKTASGNTTGRTEESPEKTM